MKKMMSEMVAETKRRMGEAFKELRRAGYVCRSAFMCCGTCASYAISETPKFKMNGKMVYYHRQDEAAFRESNEVYLGWAGDGKEIVTALERAGLRVEWNGEESKRILVTGVEPDVERDTLDEENDSEKIARETPQKKEPKGPSPRCECVWTPVDDKPKTPASAEPFEVGPKPNVKLSGEDGNAFAILGRCSVAARRFGKTQVWIDRFMDEARSGDYDHLLQTAFRFFEVS